MVGSELVLPFEEANPNQSEEVEAEEDDDQAADAAQPDADGERGGDEHGVEQDAQEGEDEGEACHEEQGVEEDLGTGGGVLDFLARRSGEVGEEGREQGEDAGGEERGYPGDKGDEEGDVGHLFFSTACSVLPESGLYTEGCWI